jgi:SAM-dependent methyltransferase
MGNTMFWRVVGQVYGWACQRIYHELAWAYEMVAALVSFGRWGNWRRSALCFVKGNRVLELGFGTGALLDEAGAHRNRCNLRMTGIDPSPQMQAQTARRLASSAQKSVSLVSPRDRNFCESAPAQKSADLCESLSLAAPHRPNRVQSVAQALPFVDGHFDSVLATFPADFILQPTTLAECARVLNRDRDGIGGRLVIVGLWVALELAGLRPQFPLFYGRPSARAQAELSHLLQRAGFEVHFNEQVDGPFRVGIVLADLKPAPAPPAAPTGGAARSEV